ncbi:MAG: hypothetical protein AABY64_14370 [Bdellovibrionota bacterium]
MRNLIIGIIVALFSVANAAKDDLKFVTESADIKPIACKPQSQRNLEDLCKEVVKEKCSGEPTSACLNIDTGLINKRVSSPELNNKIYLATLNKFNTQKANYEKKCGTRFTDTTLVLEDFAVGVEEPKYDQVKNEVKIPNWMLFNSTSGEIDTLIAEQLSISCLYSLNNSDELIKLDIDAMKSRVENPNSVACRKLLNIVETNLKSIETEDQMNCREREYAKFSKDTCIEKYGTIKDAYSKLLFINDKSQFSHWTRGCHSPNKERLALNCYFKNPSSNFETKICAPKTRSGSSSADATAGGR